MLFKKAALDGIATRYIIPGLSGAGVVRLCTWVAPCGPAGVLDTDAPEALIRRASHGNLR